MVKQIAKYAALVFFTLLGILLLGMWLLFNNNYVQNKVTGYVTDYLSAQFKTKIQIGHISYHPLTQLSLDQVYFGDHKNDTLFYVEHLKLNIGSFNADSLKLTFTDVLVDGGLCKMVTYPDNSFNIDVLFNIVSADKIPDTASLPFSLVFNQVACTHTRFRLIDSTSELGGEGFNGLDEDFYDVAFEATNFSIIGDSLNLNIKKLSCLEKGGAQIKRMDCQAILASSGMYFNDLDFEARYSHIKGNFSMAYKDWDMADFNYRVNMKANIKESRIDMRDVADFAPALKGWNQVAYLSGDVSGTVNQLRAKRIELRTGDKTYFRGNVNLSGLPEIDETFMEAKVEQVISDGTDIEYICREELPAFIDKFGEIKFKGAFTGFVKDFVAHGKFSTEAGDVLSDFNIKLADSVMQSAYKGKIELDNFNVGKVFDMEPTLGQIKMQINLDGKGFDLEHIATNIGLNIDYAKVAGYRYSALNTSGRFDTKRFNGNFVSNDPNARFDISGEVDLSEDEPTFRGNANMQYINLTSLGLIDSANVTLKAKLNINFAFKDLDHNNGSIAANQIELLKNGKDLDLSMFRLYTVSQKKERIIDLKTDYASLNFKGEYSFDQLPDNFYHFMHLLAPAYFNKIVPLPQRQLFSYQLKVEKAAILNELFIPDLHIKKLEARGQIDSDKQSMVADLSADLLHYNLISLHEFRFHSTIENGSLGKVSSTIREFKNNDTLVFHEFSMHGNLAKNKGLINLYVSDTGGIATGNIVSELLFTKDQIQLMLDSSFVEFRDATFNIMQNGELTYRNQHIDIKNIRIAGPKEDILVNGFYETDGIHLIKTEIKRLDLELVNTFDRTQTIAFNGETAGTIVFKGNTENNNIDAFLNINELILDKDTIGDLSFTSAYDDKQKRLLLYTRSLSGKLKELEAGGYIDMRAAPYALKINVAFAESDLKSFQAFLKEQVLITTGTVQAKCIIEGTIDDIEINGKIEVANVVARIEYLKSVYRFNSVINFNGSEIEIPAFEMYDINNRKAIIAGKILHHSFSKFSYDINIHDLNRFQLLSTTAKDNNLFYGIAYASGNIHLSGPQTELMLDGNLKTEKGTVFNIPLTQGENDESTLISFVNRDTNITIENMVKPVKLFGFMMNMIVNITPDAEINIVFDEFKGDKISGAGDGMLKMEMTKQGLFNMFGEVKISNGEYKFTALDFFTKKFNLKKGSAITWSGDPLQARLDITGAYNVRRTSVANILTTVSDEQRKEAQNQRVPAECLMYIKGSLQEPQYKFDLAFTEVRGILSSSTVNALESSLNSLRAEPQQMEQQVINLILFGNFLPLGGSQQFAGNSSLASGLNNTLSDIASAQASNFLDQVIPGLDVNIDLSRNDQQNFQAIISASKKLLDDRLEVQGSLNSVNNNNNLMTQYNLTKEGNLKLRAYSRSITDPIYNRPINTQGLGLFYRKEFDSFFKQTSKDTSAVSVN
ncbi:MAG: translocation/assembly module TamB domain-containing protein [Bacteroidota bacterium]|nr:translocation/assembly module TamB [Sphingobacteriales bacterium]